MSYAKSIMGYLGRWMQHRFLEGEQLDLFALPAPTPSSVTQTVAAVSEGCCPHSTLWGFTDVWRVRLADVAVRFVFPLSIREHVWVLMTPCFSNLDDCGLHDKLKW
ncbi:hypothetical protein [Edaphobacter aggregans]|uniref:hypothetical protein n=1 Tax=Edaphobacter aggregans TaxID=570835 RepID=UPI00054F1DE0|nr:hypothetical protein [Edaphobacter aggregans]